MDTAELEKKLDLILDKLERIESILLIEEVDPEEDEIEAIKEYLRAKKKGKLEMVPLEALSDV